MARDKPLGEGLKGRGSGVTRLRLVNDDAVGDLVANAVAGTMGADVPTVVTIPKPASVAAVPPLSKLWDEVVPVLAEAGILHSPDVLILEGMLRHMLAFRDASDELILNGPVITAWAITKDGDQVEAGTERNPADLVMRGQSNSLMSYMKEMGLTLVSRARVPGKDSGPKPDQGNPFAPGAGATSSGG